MSNVVTYTLTHDFHVSELMKVLDVDFIYAYRPETKEYLILNNEMYGTFAKSLVDAQKNHNRILIINNSTLKMEAYNIEEAEINEAFANMAMG